MIQKSSNESGLRVEIIIPYKKNNNNKSGSSQSNINTKFNEQESTINFDEEV